MPAAVMMDNVESFREMRMAESIVENSNGQGKVCSHSVVGMKVSTSQSNAKRNKVIKSSVMQEVELLRSEDTATSNDSEDSLSTLDSVDVSPSSLNYLLPAPFCYENKKLVVVLDLDETLVRFREGPVFWRPHFNDLLDSIKSVCEVVLWTASTERCAARIMGELDPRGDRLHHHIYRSDAWFTGVPYTKDLTLLGRPMEKVLIIENTPQCVFKNPGNAIIVEDYILPNELDRHLAVVRDAILAMAEERNLNIPNFLLNSPLIDTVE
eukprot:gene20272-31190_t